MLISHFKVVLHVHESGMGSESYRAHSPVFLETNGTFANDDDWVVNTRRRTTSDPLGTRNGNTTARASSAKVVLADTCPGSPGIHSSRHPADPRPI
mmetsp:Transcript_30101/g.48530  ORF Transcript_30101/g.48530 Transcript_30101/m.48530 type:complete len:96 (+) Transcript_30101:1054-1341(+)